MKYIKLNNGVYVNTLSNINTVWDENNYCTPEALIKDGKAEQFGVVPLVTTPQPEYDSITQSLREDDPELIEAEWVQRWLVVDLSPEEIEANRQASVPAAVTMRQARLALLGAGLLDDIDAAINSLPSPQKEAARIEWEYSQEVQRHNGFVSALAPMLGLTDRQIDDLFVLGQTL